MTKELSRFAAVMFVVLSGFVMALHALTMDEMLVSQADTWGHVFLAMLGDTSIFDIFTGRREARVGDFLLGCFFIVSNIVLLNLLIGILSTEYDLVREKIDLEFKVSKARVIEYYRHVVEKDWLPAPFNLVQIVLCLPFMAADIVFERNMHDTAREAVGTALFWLASSAFVVPFGCLLWVVSLPRAILLKIRHMQVITAAGSALGQSGADSGSIVWDVNKWVSWYIIGAPLCICCFWLRGAVLSLTGASWWVRNQDRGYHRVSDTDCSGNQEDTPSPAGFTLAEVLAGTRGTTVSKLRQYLEDPMTDPVVREDEKSREITVGHLKLFLNHLEDSFAKPIKEDISTTFQSIEERLRRTEDKLEDVLARLSALVAKAEG